MIRFSLLCPPRQFMHENTIPPQMFHAKFPLTLITRVEEVVFWTAVINEWVIRDRQFRLRNLCDRGCIERRALWLSLLYPTLRFSVPMTHGQ